jgi:hypothetical protein
MHLSTLFEIQILESAIDANTMEYVYMNVHP